MADTAASTPLHTADEVRRHDRAEAVRLRLRPWCLGIGGVGGLLGVLAALRALGASELGGAFDVIEGRTGTGVGLVAMLMAIISLLGAAAVLRIPSLASTLMYIGGCGGFLAIGGFWLWPGILILVSANMALWAIADPLWEAPARAPRAKARARAG